MASLVVERSRPENRTARPNLPGVLAPILMASFLSALALFGIGYGFGTPALVRNQWAGAALLGLAVASTLISLARQLPWQNVMLAAMLLALGGAAVEAVLISTEIGLGHNGSRQAAEPWFWLGKVCQLSLVWIVGLLNCRGVVRLMMRPWRFAPNYGIWVLGGTLVLASIFILSFARFGPVQVESPTAESVSGVIIGTLVTLLLVTPSLINKQPVPERADWHPVVIWTAFNICFVLETVWPRK